MNVETVRAVSRDWQANARFVPAFPPARHDPRSTQAAIPGPPNDRLVVERPTAERVAAEAGGTSPPASEVVAAMSQMVRAFEQLTASRQKFPFGHDEDATWA
jgi:hypothetical protein